jgi:hypothetical protein
MTVITPTSVVRSIAVTSGAAELVWTQLTELAGLDITLDTFSLALVPSGEAPDVSDFVPTDDANQPNPADPSVYRIALLVDADTVETRGAHTLWARVVDTSETLIFPASGTVELL